MGSLFTKVLDIKRTGSNELRDSFLRELKNDVFKFAESCCRKIGIRPSDDEKSVALIAFNEALDRFDEKRNGNFEAYAKRVISSRLKDLFRKEKSERFVAYDNRNIKIISDKNAIAEFRKREYSEDLQDELLNFKQIIGLLGYKIADIEQNRPTHNDSLERLYKIALHIVKSRLGERFLKERSLSRDLVKLIGVDRRTLKKYRPYLCALIIVFLYDFPIMRSYINFGRDAGDGSQRAGH